ncbi:MAG TPA: ribose-phosphate diphosphokinase [Nevskiaceae bacterium]|nr:ribose-phosphate diphosphokinase [Nevskiaceae bacterium]
MKRASIRRLQIVTGSHHIDLAAKVAERLRVPLAQTRLERFANGEVRCQLGESVRGADVFIFQTHSTPVNDAIMEQAILIDAARRASAKHITAVCPFLGYARQDRKASGREPISAKLVIDILRVAGADRIVSVDLHSGQVQGFFNGPFDHLIAMPALADHVKNKFGRDVVIVSPDAGRVKLAERYVDRLGCGLAIIHKRRLKGGNNAEALHLIGDDVRDRQCVIIDDMIDGAGTVCAAAEQLKHSGAKNVAAIATHGLFSPPAAERLAASAIDYLAITDTLPAPTHITKPQVEMVSVVNLIADAVAAIFEERSVSALFNGENQT